MDRPDRVELRGSYNSDLTRKIVRTCAEPELKICERNHSKRKHDFSRQITTGNNRIKSINDFSSSHFSPKHIHDFNFDLQLLENNFAQKQFYPLN